MPTDPGASDKSRIHRLADVHPEATIGPRTNIWQFVVVMAGARIGSDCNICANSLVEGQAVVGNRVTVKCGVEVCDALTLEDDTFVGPNVCFTNDKYPRSKHHPADGRYAPTLVKKGASIGAGAVILPGVIVGEGAMVGAGAVVHRDVPPGCTVVGNPARVVHARNRSMEIVDQPPRLISTRPSSRRG